MSDTFFKNFPEVNSAQAANRKAEAIERRGLSRLLLLVLCLHFLVALASWRGVIRDDAESYVLIGQNLAQGNGYVFHAGKSPTAWRAPGYPLFLGGVLWLSGGSLIAVRFAQAFLWTLTAFLTYKLARRTLRHDTALIAAALAGLYPELLGMTGLIWSESLFVPLFLGAIYALFANFALTPQPPLPREPAARGERRRFNSLPSPLVREGLGVRASTTIPLSILSGVLIGVSILTRSTALILVPMVWYVAATRGKSKKTYAHAALISAIALTMTGCWTARNMVLLGKPILVESNTGYNLYVGHQPDTPIPFAWRRAEKLPTDPLYQSLTTDRGETERYTLLTQEAVGQIKAHPLHSVLLMFGKTFDFWLPDFFIALNVRSTAFGTAYAKLWPMVLLVTASAYCVVVFAAVRRAWATRKDWETRAILVLLTLYTFPHSLVYGASRYHLPLLPLLFIFAAPEIQRWAQSRKLSSLSAKEKSRGEVIS